MNKKLKYLDAVSEDHTFLSETAINSKRFWGYSSEQINLWRPDLVISKEYILRNKVVKVYDHDEFIGFFGVKLDENNEAEIDHLWLIPEKIKKGYGRLIFHHILEHLRSDGHKSATLVAEPNAKGFYAKMGGKVIGNIKGKVSDRYLDIYEYKLTK